MNQTVHLQMMFSAEGFPTDLANEIFVFSMDSLMSFQTSSESFATDFAAISFLS